MTTFDTAGAIGNGHDEDWLHVSLSIVKAGFSALYQKFAVSDRTQLAVEVTFQRRATRA